MIDKMLTKNAKKIYDLKKLWNIIFIFKYHMCHTDLKYIWNFDERT